MLKSGLDDHTAVSTSSFRLMEGERRHVAALFLDLKDFTSLSESMDHETIHHLVGGVMRALAGVVDTYGGYVDKIEGDRIMALFGATRAAENDSIRAVSCALGMLQTIESASQYLSENGINITARAGIACGSVTVAPDALGHLTAVGDTVNLASRLENIADVGTVRVSGRVFRECGDYFTWQDCGETSIRGRAGMVQTCIPLGAGPVQKDLWARSADVAKTALIGRSRELEMLDALFQLQSTGSTGTNRLGGSKHIVGRVRGAAGVGKSRLVNELLSWQEGNSWTVLRGYPRAFAQPPFTIWSSLTRNLLGIEHGAPATVECIRSKLASLVENSALEVEESITASLPENLSKLLSFDTVHYGEQADTDADDHLELMAAIRDLIRCLGSSGRVIIVLEDMHSTDSASLETLAFILSNCHLQIPLLVLCLTRPCDEDSDPCLNLESDYCKVLTIDVEPLTATDSRAVIEKITGVEVPGAAVNWLVNRSGGNPFYLTELLRYLLGSGELDNSSNTWTHSDHLDGSVPDSLAGLIRSRIDRIEPHLRKVLRYCSVLGQEFSLSHFCAYHRKTDLSGNPEDDLRSLEAMGFIQGLSSPSGMLYSFCNPLICRSAYETILYFNRKSLHRIAAEAAEESLGRHSSGSAPQIAHHWAESGVTAKAIDWGIKAMEIYAASYQHSEVAAWVKKLETWLSAWDDIERDEKLVRTLRAYEKSLSLKGNSDERSNILKRLMNMTTDGKCSRHRPYVLTQLGDFYFIAGEQGRAASCYSRALKKAEEAGDRVLQADLLKRMGAIADKRGEVSSAEEYQKQALETAREAGAKLVEADILLGMGTLTLNRGRTQEALELYQKARQVISEKPNRSIMVNILANIGMTLSIQEKNSEALEHFERALTESREIGNRKAEGVILGNMGILFQNRGSMDDALECFEDALTIAREIGARGSEGIVLGNLGILHNQQGRLFKARECYSKSLEIRREVGNRRGQAAALMNIGSLDLELGSIRSAKDCFRRALDISREIESPNDEVVALGNLSLIHLREGSLEQAEEHVRSALEIAEKIQVRQSQISNLYTFGLVLIEQQKHKEAKEVLERALESAVEIGHRQKESLVMGALGYLSLIEGNMDQALTRYLDSRTIIEELQLGRKDMDIFLRLREGLFDHRALRPDLTLPNNW